MNWKELNRDLDLIVGELECLRDDLTQCLDHCTDAISRLDRKAAEVRASPGASPQATQETENALKEQSPEPDDVRRRGLRPRGEEGGSPPKCGEGIRRSGSQAGDQAAGGEKEGKEVNYRHLLLKWIESNALIIGPAFTKKDRETLRDIYSREEG